MAEWIYAQTDRSEEVARLHFFSMKKCQPGGDVHFRITVKEFAVPPPGQNMLFFAETDKPVNQKTAPFIPCGWGNTLPSALGDCIRLIRQFPYEGEEGG